MCGLVGVLSPTQPIDPPAFDRMTDALAHRGPDGRAVRFFEEGRVALGHRRLAIVDLSEAGAQPMTNEDGTLWLVFNGEIYNHPELRPLLERAGHRYASACDSETILHAYEEWGPGCVQRFRGIFSFAIWDTRARRLFAARDHVGVKPFYYAEGAGRFLFASQPRAILAAPYFRPSIDPQGFVDYLSHGIVPDDRAAFAGMRKLPPGHTLTWHDGRAETTRFWQAAYQPVITDFGEARARVEEALEDAVRAQLMSDVPVATFLSGGVDSSLLTAVATELTGAPLDTFTIGFDEAHSDERPYARLVATHCGARHHEAVLGRADALALLDDVVETYDEPFGMGAAFPMVFLSQVTQAAGFKVILAGDGADELFAGYTHYDALHARYRRWGLRTATDIDSWLRYVPVRAIKGPFDPFAYYEPHEAIMAEPIQRRVLAPDFAERHAPSFQWRLPKYFDEDLTPVVAAQLLDLHTYLPDEILVKVDRATMASGIEARVPFLDPRLVDLAFSIDTRLHYRDGERKAVLKAAARRWLPDEVLTPRKKGFSIPLHRWLVHERWHADLVTELRDGLLVQQGLLAHEGLEATLDTLSPKVTFQLYLAERWARRWTT